MPIEDIIGGQYIDIAMPVKNAAMSGEMPLLATLEETDGERFARLDQHRDRPTGPTRLVLAGSL